MTFEQLLSTWTGCNPPEDHLDALAIEAAEPLARFLDAIELGDGVGMSDAEVASTLQKVLVMVGIDAEIECSVERPEHYVQMNDDDRVEDRGVE